MNKMEKFHLCQDEQLLENVNCNTRVHVYGTERILVWLQNQKTKLEAY